MRILLRFAYNILRLITWPLWGLFGRMRRRRTGWVALRLHGELVELPAPRGPWLQRVLTRLRPAHTSVEGIRRLSGQLAQDASAEGLLISMDGVRGGWATLQSLHRELQELRRAGKRVIVMLPQGADQRELLVAAAADAVHTTRPAPFSALGPVAQRPYLTQLLGKLGLEVQVFAQGAYKTAAESVSRDSMSEPEREQLTALLSAIQQQWLAALAQRPGLGEAGARSLLELAVFGPEQAQERGLIDSIRYEDELENELGLGPKQKATPSLRYLRKRPRPVWLPLRSAPRVVVVRLDGAIGSGARGRGIGLTATRALLRALEQNRQVLGVILHIDSPGGSAVVSELLHREIVRLDAKKPVVAWMGNIAASGGYYLAAAARHIVAQPSTITGSIGVISARPVFSGLLDRVGIRQEVVKLAPHADLHGTRALDPQEAALFEAETRRYYQRFLEVVAASRKRTPAEIEPLAGGRVWSGVDAHRNGLVDTLGGYREARAALDALLGADAAKAERDPLIAQPATLAGLADHAFSRLATSVLPGLPTRELEALWELVQSGERVLAYAELPSL